MVSLISIHIPKTGGTSFYRILESVYGVEHLSPSLKRKDLLTHPDVNYWLRPSTKVLHGHFNYREIQSIHIEKNCPVISWIRNPVDRVISNYYFFKHRLQNPALNPKTYELNKHRKDEPLITYARSPENQNRMSSFLSGLPLEKYFFIGRLEHFENDLARLAHLLNWNKVPALPALNQNTSFKKQQPMVSESIRNEIAHLNSRDIALYSAIQKKWI